MPGVLFDTDGSAYNTRRDTMRYMRLAPKIGIPEPLKSRIAAQLAREVNP